MAGAVAFVFGLCALSFAAGCVVTAVMLRRADPADEAPQPVTPPEPARPPTPAPRLVWPPDDFAAKPIHRNPVVGLPALASLDHGDPAPAALALAPDPTFAGIFDPPPARLPDVAVEPLGQSLEAEPPTARPEPVTGRVLHARSTPTGYALRGRREPASKRSLHAEQAILLKAACVPPPFDGAVQPITLRAVTDLPPTEEAEGPHVAESPDAEPLSAEPGDDRVLSTGLVDAEPPLAESGEDRALSGDDRVLLAGSGGVVRLLAELGDDRVLSAEAGDEQGLLAGSADVEPLLAEIAVDSVPSAAEEVLPIGSPGGESDRPVVPEPDSDVELSSADLDFPASNLVPVVESPAQLVTEPPVEPEPVAPVRQAITGPKFPTARNGRRREIKLELVPQSELKTPTTEAPAPEPEAVASEDAAVSAVEATDAEGLPVVVPESETVFVSRSGSVTEPASDPAPDAEAVVSEQGVKPEPVVPKQHVVANDEFRKRYLRTFEAARRRSNH